MLYVLWGVMKDEPQWKEQPLCETQNKQDIEQVRREAIEKGYDRFRVARLNMAVPPDFAGTINI